MTTVKTERVMIAGKEITFEKLYAGNQNFVYKINGRYVTSEFWFEFRNEILPYLNDVFYFKTAA